MASSTSSLHFLCLTPKTLSLSNPKLAPSLVSLKTPKSISLSPLILHSGSRIVRFVRSVAFSSDVEQSEDVFDDAREERSFSEDLKLFVGNLPFDVDSSALAELFEQAGTVEMVEVIYDKLTGRSRGFGFVTMSTVQAAEAAAQQFNGYELEGRPLRVNSGPPPPRRTEDSSFRNRGPPRGGGSSFDNTNRLYVGNLAYGVDDSALGKLFREQGKVIEAKVVYDRDSGRSRGFGFVTYSSADEVNNAIESLDGADLNGRAIRVTVAESKPRRQF